MANREMCEYCFDSLVGYFDKSKDPPTPKFPDVSYPLFVTWHKESRKYGEPQLRGCIGTFKAKHIHAGLNEYAITSAIHDRRFSPVSASEIPSLHCSVSLLTNFEEVESVWDWEINVHGIWIDFVDPNGVSRNATYLPEVAGEQGWTKEEAIESLVRKSGYKGALTQSLLSSIRLTRYQSSKSELTYTEYIALKKK